MSRSAATLLIVALTLSACGESRLNPFNWFGGSRGERPAPVENDNPLIPSERQGFFRSRSEREAANTYQGQPVDVISTLVIERVPGGAIVRATGVSRFQNVYDVRLTPVNEDEAAENGVLEYRLEAIIPQRPIAGGSEAVRRIIAARNLTNQQLEGVRSIRVAGVENARIASRR